MNFNLCHMLTTPPGETAGEHRSVSLNLDTRLAIRLKNIFTFVFKIEFIIFWVNFYVIPINCLNIMFGKFFLK